MAALLGGQVKAADEGTTVAVLSGGNVDPGLLASVARRHESQVGRRSWCSRACPTGPATSPTCSAEVAETGANIVDVSHVREGLDLHVRETAIELVIETRGHEHARGGCCRPQRRSATRRACCIRGRRARLPMVRRIRSSLATSSRSSCARSPTRGAEGRLAEDQRRAEDQLRRHRRDDRGRPPRTTSCSAATATTSSGAAASTTSSGATTRPPATPSARPTRCTAARARTGSTPATAGTSSTRRPGDDTIRVWFGRGRVDCGAGDDDILYVSKTQNKKVKRKNCERVLHKSAKDAVNDRNGLYD